MELDQDLLNLWLQAKDGLSTGQARQLILLVQDSRDAVKAFDNDGKEPPLDLGQQWGLDLRTPSASRFQPMVFPPLFAREG